MAKFADNAGVVGKGDDRVNTLSCIRPGLNGWDMFGTNLRMKVLVLLKPSVSLLRGAAVSRAFLGRVRKQSERTRRGRTVTRKAEKDGRLVGAVKSGNEMPTWVSNYLCQLRRDPWAGSNRELRKLLTMPSGRKAKSAHAMPIRVVLPKRALDLRWVRAR